jgi:hypothetical protein
MRQGVMASVFTRVNSLLTAAEHAITEMMQASYRTWLAAVRGSVMTPYNRFHLPPDPGGVWAASPFWNSRINALMRDLRELARHGWLDAAEDIGQSLPFDSSSSVLADQLQRTRNLMVRTPDEVYRRVVKELAKGGSVDEQAQRVRAYLDYAGVENWPERARTVAVTEVNRAYVFGGLAAAQRLQIRLGTLYKRWDARRDEATRAAHRRAHGQTRVVNQFFEVGGEHLMAPLDPSGSASNVINCRCRSSYLRRP